MHRKSPLLASAFAAALLLAGCMGGTEETPTTTSPTTEAPRVPAAFMLDNGATGCYEAIGLLLVDIEVAQAALPANWTAADAQVALETPQPTGQGAIWFNAFTCTNATIAQGDLAGSDFGVLVAPPRLSSNATAAPVFNVYQVMHFTDDANSIAALTSVNASVRAANVTIAHESVASAETGAVRAAAGNASAFAFEYSAFLPDTFNGTADFWQETPDGVTLFHFAIGTTPILQGSVTSCTFSDPVLVEVTGTATCPPGQAFVIVVPQQAWTSEFSWMPGVHAVAAV